MSFKIKTLTQTPIKPQKNPKLPPTLQPQPQFEVQARGRKLQFEDLVAAGSRSYMQ